MLTYYAVSVMLLIGVLLNTELQKRYNYISLFVLFILKAYRDFSVGTDTISYKIYFERLARGGVPTKEAGFSFLNTLVADWGGDMRTLMIVISILTLVPLVYICQKYSPKPAFSLFLYYNLYIYFHSFNISRQVMAVSIVLIGIPFLLENRRLLFCLIVLLASTIHVTALISLPLIFLDKVPDNRKFYITLVIGSFIIGYLFTGPILSYTTKLVGYDSYLMDRGVISTTSTTLIMTNLFFFFVLFTLKERNFLFKLFMIYVVMMNLIDRFPFSNRLLIYFSIYQILFLAYYVIHNRLKSNVLAYLIVILYSYVIFWRLLSLGVGEVLPYFNVL